MPWRITRYEPTPNPNALKCVLDAPISDRPRSFRSPADAGDDPIATRLFAVPGVAVLLLNSGWMTVNKTPAARWPAVKRGVEAALAELPDPDTASRGQGPPT